MHSKFWLVTVPAVVAAASGARDCVLAGPDYPPPSKLCGSKPLASAIAAFESKIGNATNGIESNNTAWAVALFSWKENKTIYEHYYTPPINVGGSNVDQNSIFRIGSISKVFSVYSFLIEAGDRYFNDPITKYVPELANLTHDVHPGQPGTLYDDLDSVRWDEVTLGQLASQSAGILRDTTAGELINQFPLEEAIPAFGLPQLTKNATVDCDVPGSAPCTRQDTLRLIAQRHPLYAPQTSPAYSNIAFTLLEYAQESITGRNFSTTVTSRIIEPLGMGNSSYAATPKHGIIPGGNASAVGFDIDLGVSAPSGSFYSSTSDMVKAGMAMAQSTLLSPGATRRWFSPHTQTGYLGAVVGAPWEIRYFTDDTQHLTEVYTKQGDLGNYHAGLAFSESHQLGWVVLTASTPDGTSDVRAELFDAFSEFFIPMGEEQARQEAMVNFNGKYVDEASNSSAIISVREDGKAGLGVSLVVARGQEIIGPATVLASTFHAGQSGRLYPSQLKTVSMTRDGKGAYISRLGFRATFFNETSASELEDPCLIAWTALGTPTYGQVSLDDWVFEMGEDGTAEVLDLRMWRLKLKKT